MSNPVTIENLALNGYLLNKVNISDRSPKLCHMAVNTTPASIQHVPIKYLTKELQLMAVRKDPQAVFNIPSGHVCLEAVQLAFKQDSSTYAILSNPTLKETIRALSENPNQVTDILTHHKEVTKQGDQNLLPTILGILPRIDPRELRLRPKLLNLLQGYTLSDNDKLRIAQVQPSNYLLLPKHLHTLEIMEMAFAEDTGLYKKILQPTLLETQVYLQKGGALNFVTVAHHTSDLVKLACKVRSDNFSKIANDALHCFPYYEELLGVNEEVILQMDGDLQQYFAAQIKNKELYIHFKNPTYEQALTAVTYKPTIALFLIDKHKLSAETVNNLVLAEPRIYPYLPTHHRTTLTNEATIAALHDDYSNIQYIAEPTRRQMQEVLKSTSKHALAVLHTHYTKHIGNISQQQLQAWLREEPQGKAGIEL